MSEPPTKVLWLIKGLGPGGAERLLVEQARAHDGARVELKAAYLVPYKNHLVPDLVAAGVKVACLEATQAWDLRWVIRLRRLLQSTRPDVVHGHSPLVAAITRLMVRTLPRRVRPALIYTEHNDWAKHVGITRFLNRLTLGLEDDVLAVSDGVRQSMRTAAPVTVMHHGVDLETIQALSGSRVEIRHELGIDPDEIVVGTVANLRREKGYEVLLEAAATVCAEHPNVRFVSVGQGPRAEEIRRLHADRALGDRFLLLGYRPDAVRVMSGFDVFTLASHHEGLPVALMEAIGLGLPVVATAVGGLPEVVNGAGILVPPDRPAALAAALGQVVSDPMLRRQLAREADQLASRFDIRIATDTLEQRYERLNSNAPRHGSAGG